MRDARKSRVYAAESVLPDVWTNVFGSNEDAQKWVDNLLATRWWRSRWRVSQITVGVGRNLNGKSYGWSAITLSPAARNPAVALHEIAHQVSPEGSDIASHGPEFCATFLFLVGHVMGADHSRALEQAFIEQGGQVSSGGRGCPSASSLLGRDRDRPSCPPATKRGNPTVHRRGCQGSVHPAENGGSGLVRDLGHQAQDSRAGGRSNAGADSGR